MLTLFADFQHRHFNFNRTSQQELSYQDFWASQPYSEHPVERFPSLRRHPRLKPYLLSGSFLWEPLSVGNSAMSVKLFSSHCYNSSRRRVSCACAHRSARESGGVSWKWLGLLWQKVPSTFCSRNLFCPRKCLCFWKWLSSDVAANCSLKGNSPVLLEGEHWNRCIMSGKFCSANFYRDSNFL